MSAYSCGIHKITYNDSNTVKMCPECAKDTKKLKRMLLNLFDAHYGMSYHHCGDGDGLTEAQAKEIVEFVMREHKQRTAVTGE